ncbi:MAG TPA: hypothetical protein PLH94_04625 [Fimbriimonadaceae bacterium]|nr:hypothetical protein [Fimbriimonadaceae bacterium]
MKHFVMFAFAACSSVALAAYDVQLVQAGLNRPYGIEVVGGGDGARVYFTQLPTPGVPGSMGGMNSVNLRRPNGTLSIISMGEPDPLHLSFSQGNLFWTCRSAGVILRAQPNGSIAPVLTGLMRPTGVEAGPHGSLYFTQVPTPGVPGSMGGMNTVNVLFGNVTTVLTTGEPEPTDIAVDPRTGTAYWTCKSAGVILSRNRCGTVSLFLSGLSQPNGIDTDERGNLFFTEVPTPGLSGSMGGMNKVWKVRIRDRAMTLVNAGDPEPNDISVSQSGAIYWTCTSAGVIVRAVPR